MFRIMPGDPAGLLARSQRLTEAEVVEQRELFGLDQPLIQQYWTYLHETVTGNLGTSYLTGQSVVSESGSRLWPTVLLVGVGTTLAIVFGLMAGIKGGWYRGSRFDKGSLYGSLTLYSTPEGWLGMLLLLLFAGTLGWFPTGRYSSGDTEGIEHVVDVANHLVLPALTLALGYGASYMIVMRSSLIEIKDEDFVNVARASLDELLALGVEALAIVGMQPERVRLYYRYRPVGVPLAADPDLAAHRAYGVPQPPLTPDVLRAVASRHVELARELEIATSDQAEIKSILCQRDGFEPVAAELVGRRDWSDRYGGQLTGQFLVDRDGIIRWVNIEGAKDGLAGLERFPTDDEFLEAARTVGS
jgi:hypothetical protein